MIPDDLAITRPVSTDLVLGGESIPSPALTYLSSLSKGSRPTMLGALHTLAHLSLFGEFPIPRVDRRRRTVGRGENQRPKLTGVVGEDGQNGKREEGRNEEKIDLQEVEVVIGSGVSGDKGNRGVEITEPIELVKAFEWHRLRYQHTVALRGRLAEKYEAATVNKILVALKRVLLECWRMGLIDQTDYARAIDLKPVRGNTPLKGRALNRSEIDDLLEVCLKDPCSVRGARDAALIGVARSGLRRSEIVKLQIEDIDLETGEIRVVKGKGNKNRTCYLTPRGIELVEKWLLLSEKVKDYEDSPENSSNQKQGDRASNQKPVGNIHLFVPITKSGRLLDKPLTDGAILHILKTRGKEAGLDHFSPHDMRRTFATDLFDANVDIETIAQLMGHSNVQTSARYSRRGEKKKMEAVSKLW
jgi:integrase